MADTFVKIATVTVGSGGASSIDFTSIPNTYTDLCIKVSARGASGAGNITGTMRFNSDTGNNYSARRLDGDGTNAQSATFSSAASIYAFYAVDPSYTANTFGNAEIYIPNYNGSAYKSVSTDSAQENNATAALQTLTAGIWNNTSAITSISLGIFTGNLAQYSTATLYGIKNS